MRGRRAAPNSCVALFFVKTESPTRGAVIEHAVRVGDVIGGAVRDFIPAGGEFMAQAERERQVAAQLDGVLDVPGAEKAAPAEFVGGRGPPGSC